MHLKISRVTDARDFAAMMPVQFRAFAPVDLHTALFGPDDPKYHAQAAERFAKTMAADPADCWIKVVDEDTGKIVSGSQWKVYPSVGMPSHKDEPQMEITWWDGVDEKKAAGELIEDFLVRREKWMGGHPHVLLYILFTEPEYQRKGVGAMQVKWGCDLADTLGLPAWVEGSPQGHDLYAKYGFKDCESVDVKAGKWSSQYTVMKRDVTTAPASASNGVA